MEHGGRNSAQDLIKWLAMASMLVDHLRYLFPKAEVLFILGRFAFPFFSLAMAINIARAPSDSMITDANSRYLIWLIVFTVISEIPYRWLDWSSSTTNIMPTLMLGLLVAWGIHYRSKPSLFLSIGVTLLAVALNSSLMYGVYGVLLPGIFLMALKYKSCWPLIAALVCVAANNRNVWVTRGDAHGFVRVIWIAAFLAPLVGLYLANISLGFRVWRVGRWGYFFYPAHLLAIKLIKIL